MDSRRDFIQGMLASLGISMADQGFAASLIAADDAPQRESDRAAQLSSPEKTGSDVGSLFPFVQSQAVRGEFPLSFLQPDFRDLVAWKQRARGRLLDLLHYAPPPVDPRPEVVERTDQAAYVREKVLFNTTPHLRVPAYVLIPKR